MSQALRQPRFLAMIVGSFGLIAVMVWSIMLATPRTVRADGPAPVTAAEVGSLLLRAGLSAESLTAIGLSSESAGLVAAAAAEEAVESIAAVRDADAAVVSADDAYNTAVRLARRDPAQTESLGSLAAALTAAQSTRDAAIAAIRTAGVTNLSNDQKQMLTNIAANSRFGAGTALASVNRSEASWVALRDALSHEKIQTERGLSVNQDAASLLESARGGVSSAQAALNTNLAGVTSAWNAAVAGALN